MYVSCVKNCLTDTPNLACARILELNSLPVVDFWTFCGNNFLTYYIAQHVLSDFSLLSTILVGEGNNLTGHAIFNKHRNFQDHKPG